VSTLECNVDGDCPRSLSCCNWDNALGAVGTDGPYTCGEMCTQGGGSGNNDDDTTTGEVPCPTERPVPSAKCTGPYTADCKYDEYCCESTGDCLFTFVATCHMGHWLAAAVDPMPCPPSCTADHECPSGMSCCTWDSALGAVRNGPSPCRDACPEGDGGGIGDDDDDNGECRDLKPTSWCRKQVRRCSMSTIKRKCLRTCNECATEPEPEPEPEPVCEDAKGEQWCQARRQMCRGRSFKKTKCARTCGECTPSDGNESLLPPPSPSPPSMVEEPEPEPVCEDAKGEQWCQARRKKCKGRVFKKTKCARTCGECTPSGDNAPPSPPPSTVGECKNARGDSWCLKKRAKCNTNWIQAKCKKMCSVC